MMTTALMIRSPFLDAGNDCSSLSYKLSCDYNGGLSTLDFLLLTSYVYVLYTVGTCNRNHQLELHK